jgi:hypothetical protein
MRTKPLPSKGSLSCSARTGQSRINFGLKRSGRDFEHKTIFKPLEPFHDKMLILRNLHNKVRGDGDNHMRGMSCLLTGIELFPGNVMGGGNTPSGWPKGISIDREISKHLQSQDRKPVPDLELYILESAFRTQLIPGHVCPTMAPTNLLLRSPTLTMPIVNCTGMFVKKDRSAAFWKICGEI